MSQFSKSIVIGVILCLFITTGPSLMYGQNQPYDENELKVIVKLKVPNIDALTIESRKYKTVHPGKSFDSKGHQADERLKEAIHAVTDIVITQLEGTNFKVNRTFTTLPLLALDVDQEGYNLLYSMKEVLNVREDRRIPRMVTAPKTSNRSKPHSQGELSQTLLDGTVGIIGADNAWNMGFTGEGWYVAIIDCGILTSHEMFIGKSIVEKCYSIWNHCPDNTSEMTGTGAAAQHPGSYLYYDHGTKVAAIAAGDNGYSAPGNDIYGVAQNADIIAVKVCSRDEEDCDLYTVGTQPCASDQISDTIKGLEYIYNIRGYYSIAAVNLSLGYDAPDYNQDDQDDMEAAIDNLKAADIPTIVATGNGNSCTTLRFPASYVDAVSVGASTNLNARWVGSNNSSLQDLYAPGVAVMTAEGSGPSEYSDDDDGTSHAAPHVTGAWALMKQAWPDGSVDDILNTLINNGVSVPPGCIGGVTKPRIQVDSAIQSLQQITVTAPTSSSCFSPGGHVAIRWNSRAIAGNVTLTATNHLGTYTIQQNYPCSTGFYTWTIPSDFSPYVATTIQVRQGNIYDDSDPFGIGTIDITYPSALVTLYKGNTYTVQWDHSGLNCNVMISALIDSDSGVKPIPAEGELSKVNVAFSTSCTISSNYPVTNGSVNWTVPTTLVKGKYNIYININNIIEKSSTFYIQ